MKAQRVQTTGIGMVLILVWLLTGFTPVMAMNDSGEQITVSGVVRDKLNKRKLEYVNISVPGSNVGTVTNADGEFTLVIKTSLRPQAVEVSHVGYVNDRLKLNGADILNQEIWLTPYVNLLGEVTVHGQNPLLIVQEAIRKVSLNYSTSSNLLNGFYREIAQKGRRYINISEAIVDVYKTGYGEPLTKDRVQIDKGRRLLSSKQSDTLAVKLLGGPTMFVYLDVVKNPDFLLDPQALSDYHFIMEEPTSIDNRAQFVIRFEPRVIQPYALCYGKLYIDKERLSFTRAEFSLSLDDKNKATQAILKRKPFGLRFKPLEVSYLVTYKTLNGVTYLNYVRNNIRFKCDWKRKLFSTTYTVLSEMVVTDRQESPVDPISFKASFKPSQVFSDRVDDFGNEDFWKGYNIIEPTESLENAVAKLKKQQK
ncbi:carboxypeptidase-like regulatory domain-containing protein [Bacteroides neonati]|uniref:carboxypeptidase-like regulatory domain-containing protein n=1 Tax=Bacteroides neonati TaxID=1347393 RepID=UPI0004B26DCD|nr:carboxypeptidase-like regulatory domain-containing protein [Bacteroides neonati]